MVSDITKSQKTSASQRTQNQTNEARNETSTETVAPSGKHENPKDHIEEIAMKDPPTENMDA